MGAVRLAILLSVLASAGDARAEKPACNEFWAMAVRSYLDKNRLATPDGNVPYGDTPEIRKTVAAEWAKAFVPPCAAPKKDAKVEVVATGVEILNRLADTGCARFLENMVHVRDPAGTCSAAKSADAQALRALIRSALPHGRSKGLE